MIVKILGGTGSTSSDLLLRLHGPLEAGAIEVLLQTTGEPPVSLKDCSILLVAGDLGRLSIGCQVGERLIKRGPDYEVFLSYRSLGIVSTNKTVMLPSHAQESLKFQVEPMAISLPEEESIVGNFNASFSLTLLNWNLPSRIHRRAGSKIDDHSSNYRRCLLGDESAEMLPIHDPEG